ncbi:MAG: 16S rRNA processing protein RimM, partial [Clostridia bacterium]
MQRIVVGTITKPQGVKGELKVLPLTDDVERFEELKRIYLDGVGYDVTDARIAPNGVFLQLDGVTTVEQAAALKNCNIEIDRIDA